MQCSKKRNFVVVVPFSINQSVFYGLQKFFQSFQTLKLTNTHVIGTLMLIRLYIQIIVVCNTLVVFYLNILSINLKVYFPRWRFGHYAIVTVMNGSILMYYLKLTSCIQLKNQKIKTLNVSSEKETSLKMNEEKFGLSVSAVFCWRI